MFYTAKTLFEYFVYFVVQISLRLSALASLGVFASPWVANPLKGRIRVSALKTYFCYSSLCTFYLFNKACPPLMYRQTLSRGTLRSLRAHFVRLPSESKAFFGASVPGLEHTLSPRGVCSRIPHTMSRPCCITYHRKAHIIPFFVTPRLRGLLKF